MAEEVQDKEHLPMLRGGQLAFVTNALLKANGAPGRPLSMNDLLNIELVNDKLKKVDEAWVTMMVVEKAPDEDSLAGPYH